MTTTETQEELQYIVHVHPDARKAFEQAVSKGEIEGLPEEYEIVSTSAVRRWDKTGKYITQDGRVITRVGVRFEKDGRSFRNNDTDIADAIEQKLIAEHKKPHFKVTSGPRRAAEPTATSHPVPQIPEYARPSSRVQASGGWANHVVFDYAMSDFALGGWEPLARAEAPSAPPTTAEQTEFNARLRQEARDRIWLGHQTPPAVERPQFMSSEDIDMATFRMGSGSWAGSWASRPAPRTPEQGRSNDTR